MSDETLEVDARIARWRQGPYGDYAFADFTHPGVSAGAALLSSNTGTPEIDIPFRCRIKKDAKGWRVVELIFDDLPELLADEVGLVFRREGRYPAWEVKLDESLGLGSAPTVLPRKVLLQHQISDIDDGTPIHFDAQLERGRYTVTALHAPTADAAFPGYAGEPIDAVAHVAEDWTGDGNAKGLALAVRAAPSAPVVASLWLPTYVLRKFGLRSLCATETAKSDESALDHAEQALQGSDPVAADAFKVDRLLVSVRRAANGRWEIARVLRPRSCRAPKEPSEKINWIQGQVINVRDAPPPRDGGSTAGAGANAKVIVEICYRELGFGVGYGDRWYNKAFCKAAGLAPGTPVVVQLIANEQDWKIDLLHRSTPIVAPDPDDA